MHNWFLFSIRYSSASSSVALQSSSLGSQRGGSSRGKHGQDGQDSSSSALSRMRLKGGSVDSAGLRQMNMFLRTKSDSGKKLSDEVMKSLLRGKMSHLK